MSINWNELATIIWDSWQFAAALAALNTLSAFIIWSQFCEIRRLGKILDQAMETISKRVPYPPYPPAYSAPVLTERTDRQEEQPKKL